MPLRSILAGCGGYLPERVVTNEELSRTVDTSDEWIRERTGIRQRHFASKHETTAFMGTAAAQDALRDADATAADVDAIILATSTPDQAFPASALRVQAALGVTRGFGFDLSAACAGFIYGLSLADGMIRSGQATGVLVIGSEVYSRILNWKDRGTCVLFGDGAGAVFVRARNSDDHKKRGVLSTHIHAQGTLGDILYVDGAVGQPDKTGYLVMNGREVFRHAVTRLAEAVEEALAANGLTRNDVDWLVPHQANIRIIDAMGRKLGLPPERVVVTVGQHANTSAASVPLALTEARRDGRIRAGDLVLLEALGGGLTWGSALVRL
ncbi:MAG: 3-oxoacyl-[acyl-carrier-protein] synthase [Pseudonocardiales bacterium]|jgi:3-oxoacyl-[acyl-carrier-protein] synthase-3|nr:3-oxoacyl-[acyl-carrier-protein] synthase [Pseudonocardiales bacterium]